MELLYYFSINIEDRHQRGDHLDSIQFFLSCSFFCRQWSREISRWPFIFLKFWKICIRIPGANRSALFFAFPPMEPWNQSQAINFSKILKICIRISGANSSELLFFFAANGALKSIAGPSIFKFWKIWIRIAGANWSALYFPLPPMELWNQSLAIHYLKILKNLYPDTRSKQDCTFFFHCRHWSLENSRWPLMFLRFWKICIRIAGANKSAPFFPLPPMEPWNQSLAIHFIKFLKNLYPDTRSELECTFICFAANGALKSVAGHSFS